MTTYYSLSHRPNSAQINGLSPRTNLWSHLSPCFIQFQEVVKTHMLFHKIQNWTGVRFFIRGDFRKCFNSVHHKLVCDHLAEYINKLTLPFPTELAYFQAQLLQSIHKSHILPYSWLDEWKRIKIIQNRTIESMNHICKQTIFLLWNKQFFLDSDCVWWRTTSSITRWG